MIGKKGKLLLFCYMIFLVVLFLMCSTDLIIREPEQEVYQIAVIIEDASDNNYSNFRKGMDQAAVELNADVRFITLYEKLEPDQQIEFIMREQQDGADALIVAPVDEQKLFDALSQKQITVPTVLLGSGLAGEEIIGSISSDYKKMGQELTSQMLRQMPQDAEVIILSEQKKRSMAGEDFRLGITQELGRNGCAYQTNYCSENIYLKESLQKAMDSGKRHIVILTESPEILTQTAAAAAEDSNFMESICGIYGRGSTTAILNYLDRGFITGTCAVDEFGMGYYSVCMAVKELEGLEGGKALRMDYQYIEKEDLRKKEYEKMLFPIE
ncbi:sugar ABC transporter substrate-binding protein [Parablautia intestinalis]|uniref:sugar ABC transporter substrate-binding protein n=1 Tax=Parablautia intestinalis TaxID=2320100 RepID=UPI00256EFEB2|nr:substrate-binding domain-containing protein [Parablautia intestinalis]